MVSGDVCQNREYSFLQTICN